MADCPNVTGGVPQSPSATASAPTRKPALTGQSTTTQTVCQIPPNQAAGVKQFNDRTTAAVEQTRTAPDAAVAANTKITDPQQQLQQAGQAYNASWNNLPPGMQVVKTMLDNAVEQQAKQLEAVGQKPDRTQIAAQMAARDLPALLKQAQSGQYPPPQNDDEKKFQADLKTPQGQQKFQQIIDASNNYLKASQTANPQPAAQAQATPPTGDASAVETRKQVIGQMRENSQIFQNAMQNGTAIPKLDQNTANDKFLSMVDYFSKDHSKDPLVRSDGPHPTEQETVAGIHSRMDQYLKSASEAYKKVPEDKRQPFPMYLANEINKDSDSSGPRLPFLWVAAQQFSDAYATAHPGTKQ